MKSKVILFKTSGILKIVLAGTIFLLFLLVLLLSGVLKNFYLDNYTLVEEMVAETVRNDPSQAFLQTTEDAEVVDYIMKPVIQLALFFVFYGLIGIGFGVLNLVFTRKYDDLIGDKTSKKVWFVVMQFLFAVGIITNILSTVAVFVKDKKKLNEDLQ